MRPAWYYERQAQQAQARADYYRNRTPPAEDTTIESRGAMTDVFYRSLTQVGSTDHLIYSTAVPAATLTLVSAAEAGLMTALGTGETASRLRGSGVRPTKLHWYRGRATAIRRRTAWNTSVSVYYDDTSGQSHYSIPFSKASGPFSPDDLKDAFMALFGPSGTKRSLMGAVNGRAYIEWERSTVSART